jgi:hypothetical protein
LKAIQLTCGVQTIIDDCDFHKFSKFKWRAAKTASGFYAAREVYLGNKKSKAVLLHREITGCCKGFEIDHVNGDTLDNRRMNLRVCSHAENMRNRRLNRNNKSGFKGVVCHGNKWRAEIKHNGRKMHLGIFDKKEDAARVRRDAEIKLFGDFVRQN